ncbi:MAG: cytidylate kinase-like family protein [Oscillospiraceae bacterium]|nr:cytidylate kinase-like family protein [Oscillospiraceae bacterium]
MKPFIITIERQYGSGGKTVGKMLAKKLNIPFYNHEIVSMASEESGINAVYFSDERLKPSLIERLRTRGGDTSVLNDSRERYLTDDALFEHQTKVIRRLANEGPCVIVGRCADFVLKGRKDVVRVFVHADDDFCLEQAMLVNSLSVSQVKKKIAEVDEYHAKYYKYHTGKDWYDARNYDLSLNSGVLGFEGTMNEILNYMQVREQAAQE